MPYKSASTLVVLRAEVCPGDTGLAIAVVQWPSRVWLFVTPWTAMYQASLSFTISRSLLRLISIELVMPSKRLILCHFPMSWFFASGGQNIGASASASVLPMSIQSWFHLGLTSLISLQGTLKSLLQHHNSKASIPWCPTFFMVQLSHLPGLAQTHVCWVGDAIQPSCPLLSPSPAFNLSQHQGLF